MNRKQELIEVLSHAGDISPHKVKYIIEQTEKRILGIIDDVFKECDADHQKELKSRIENG